MNNKKVVFISGGSTGLGYELAKLYTSKGHIVAVCGRDEKKFVAFKDIQFFQADVSNEQAMRDIIYSVAAQNNNQLDLVVANAGIAYPNKTKIPDFKYSRKMVDINVYGVINTLEPAIELMLKNGKGHIVAVSSVAGHNGLPGVSFYSASKSFVMKLCESFNVDLEQYGIITSCIIPGFVDTPLTRVNPHPMPFMISAEDAAKKIFRGLESQKRIIALPWQWSLITRTLSLLPRKVYRAIMGISIFNFSKQK